MKLKSGNLVDRAYLPIILQENFGLWLRCEDYKMCRMLYSWSSWGVSLLE